MQPPQSSLETPKKQVKNDPPSSHQERPRAPMWLQSWQIFSGSFLTDIFLVFPGVVGDWINYFTPKQRSVFDELFTEKMKHSDVGRCLKEYINSDEKWSRFPSSAVQHLENM